ncbi:hypothetical protein [Fibrobacter sp. UWB7]|jgi:hypothetical protein|uniref:hypothetical protein n=1 Tax=Fibrobacter sp. UWB7 TaxID=1896206 RepID=UPI000920F4B2|nr:hypothetical protein [Fibrobacter sp. UWB7]SHM23799.1 hypothetical protein SAMN05720467_1031 [Fibrobacter sp. UWB7]
MISNVTQHGNLYWIIDEDGNRSGSIDTAEGLVNFTSETVSVRHGKEIWIFDEKGNRTSVVNRS